jgi:hypothetical protein
LLRGFDTQAVHCSEPLPYFDQSLGDLGRPLDRGRVGSFRYRPVSERGHYQIDPVLALMANALEPSGHVNRRFEPQSTISVIKPNDFSANVEVTPPKVGAAFGREDWSID